MKTLKPKTAKKSREAIHMRFESSTKQLSAQEFLKSKCMEYHTYGDKRNVIRGLPVKEDNSAITADLQEQGISAIVHQMQSPARVLPIYLVKVTPTQREAQFNVNRLIGLVISVEKLKQPTARNQCFRCQRFSHTRTHCDLQQRCVLCAEGHVAKDCVAGCANCGEAHRQVKSTNQATTKPPPKNNRSTARKVTKMISYADYAKN